MVTRTTTGQRNPWAVLAVLCLANFLILLDTTIVNTAVPDIMATLRAGIDSALWVLNGYLLAFASLLIVCGRLGDVLGPRRIFVAGLVVFTVASVLCGLSRTPVELVGARVVQGAGAAMLVPQALVLISAIFPSDRRGAAFGIFTATAGIASVGGPTLGGLLVTESGWRSVFLLNLPVGLAGIVLTFRLVPDPRPNRSHRLDVVGVVLATLGLVGAVYAITEAHHHGVGVTVVVSVLAGACVVSFGRRDRRRVEPLVPAVLFVRRNFGIAAAITVISSFALYGFLFVFVLETQSALGMSPLTSGVSALPMTVTLSVLAPLAGRLADRIGGRVLLVAGLVLDAVGLAGVAVLPAATSTQRDFVLPLVVIGAGIGLSVAPTTTEAMRPIHPEHAGAASGVLNTARQVGAALGAAVIGSVFQARLAVMLHQAAAASAAGLPAADRGLFRSAFEQAVDRGLRLGDAGQPPAPAGLPSALADRFDVFARHALGHGVVAATRPALGVVAGVAVLGAVLAAFMVPRHGSAAGDRGA